MIASKAGLVHTFLQSITVSHAPRGHTSDIWRAPVVQYLGQLLYTPTAALTSTRFTTPTAALTFTPQVYQVYGVYGVYGVQRRA